MTWNMAPTQHNATKGLHHGGKSKRFKTGHVKSPDINPTEHARYLLKSRRKEEITKSMQQTKEPEEATQKNCRMQHVNDVWVTSLIQARVMRQNIKCYSRSCVPILLLTFKSNKKNWVLSCLRHLDINTRRGRLKDPDVLSVRGKTKRHVTVATWTQSNPRLSLERRSKAFGNRSSQSRGLDLTEPQEPWGTEESCSKALAGHRQGRNAASGHVCNFQTLSSYWLQKFLSWQVYECLIVQGFNSKWWLLLVFHKWLRHRYTVPDWDVSILKWKLTFKRHIEG